MVRYPVTLAPDDNGTLLVTFPDFPGAHTSGDDEPEALARALDTLETIIDAYIRDRQDIPAPSPATGPSVGLPALVAAKVQIYTAMRQQKIGKTALSRRLGVHLPQIDRLLDIKHGSKLDQLEAAARALGGTLEVVVSWEDSARGTESATKLGAGRSDRARGPRRPGHAAVLNLRTPSRRLAGSGKKK